MSLAPTGSIDLVARMAIERVKQRASATDPKSTFKRTYRDDPVAFVHDVIRWKPGTGPAPYQDEILSLLPRHHRVAAFGPHGLGKTTLEAWTTLWFSLTRDGDDWKSPSTASAWRQLTHYLWPEIRKWAHRINWSLVYRDPFNEYTELTALRLKLTSGEAFAVASTNSELIEGAHADHLFYCYDESKAISPATFDSTEGAFAGSGEALALACSTPGEPAGRFYDICRRAPGYEDWYVRHVTLDEVIAAGRVSRSWAHQRALQWGEESAVYKNRVLGIFASGAEDAIIPLTWVEAANERWHEWVARGRPTPFTCLGVDVAWGGADRTVFAHRHGHAISELETHRKENPMETAGRVRAALRVRGGYAVVDVIGLGGGTYASLLEEDDYGFTPSVQPFNASERTDKLDAGRQFGFINKRAAAWWNLRELLNPDGDDPIALPPDDTLTGDLTAPGWRVASSGKIQVDGKDEIYQKLKRSPDYGDAVAMAFWSEPPIRKKRGILAHVTVRRGWNQPTTAVPRRRFR